MGHVHERDAYLVLELLELYLQLAPELGIQRAERLVEQQHCGLEHERTRQGNSLLLTAGELTWFACRVLGQLNKLEYLA